VFFLRIPDATVTSRAVAALPDSSRYLSATRY